MKRLTKYVIEQDRCLYWEDKLNNAAWYVSAWWNEQGETKYNFTKRSGDKSRTVTNNVVLEKPADVVACMRQVSQDLRRWKVTS
jgi:hypothetical protein